MKVSVIIPVFNEEKAVGECIKSLQQQSWKDMEIIIVDDGSTDKSREIISFFSGVKLLEQSHKGAGAARNLGGKSATGEILVFVDADMVFDGKFIEMLTKPIMAKKTIGTFSRNEMVLNKKNVWSKCWNINKGLPIDRMHPKNYPDKQLVFRAILKKEFDKVGGFNLIGYIDDYTLSEKIGVKAIDAKDAFFYHRNPETVREVFQQARWIGKSEFKRRRIKSEFIMKLVTMVRYSLPLSLINGIIKSLIFRLPQFLLFKVIYDLAIETSVIGSFFKEQKYK